MVSSTYQLLPTSRITLRLHDFRCLGNQSTVILHLLTPQPISIGVQMFARISIYAFFTRSSAANIPVNLDLAKRLKLNPDMYSVSIPLGATINMGGAAITITVMTLAAAHTLGIIVDVPTAILLSVIATIGACGASGVAGGSCFSFRWHVPYSVSPTMWLCK